MDNERAIEVLYEFNNNVKPVLTEELEDATDLAISALEKQMPKKLETDIEQNYWNCPNCKTDFMGCYLEEDPKHCYTCGQKLDWSEV